MSSSGRTWLARQPVVIATGQAIDRDGHGDLGPLELLEQAGRNALDSAASRSSNTWPGLEARIERVSVVSVLAQRAGRAPATSLAKALGITGATCETTTVGGNMPQLLVNRAASDILAGKLDATLIAGAEVIRTPKLKPEPQAETAAARSSSRHDRPTSQGRPDEPPPPPDPVYGEMRQDLSDEERAAGLFIPVLVYPLFQSALAARAGRTNAEERAHIGSFMSGFTDVAAENPYAWFRDRLSPADIATPASDNRLVAEPYTKKMVAFLGAAQASVVIVTSYELAEAAGLAGDAVFVLAGADAEDIWYPIERPDLGASPAIATAAGAAFTAAGAHPDDLSLIDLYSCFPCAVEIAAKEIGLSLDDPRGLTVTGGLPYAGGPGNNYVGHSIATMAERLRSTETGGSAIGLLTGVGWYLTKHSVGIYSNTPPQVGEGVGESGRFSKHVPPFGEGAAASPVSVAASVDEPTRAVVEAGTLVYGREGEAMSVPVLARLADGRRVAAAVVTDELGAAAELAARAPLVGANVEVRPGSPPTYSLVSLPD